MGQLGLGCPDTEAGVIIKYISAAPDCVYGEPEIRLAIYFLENRVYGSVLSSREDSVYVLTEECEPTYPKNRDEDFGKEVDTSMIELKDIVVKFDKFTALHNINVHVKEGEFFTFLGPSGCGKTTTLRTITGFIEPVEGTVSVKGRDITHVAIEDRNIGIVFQSYALFPTMTVYDNIAFGLKVKKLKKPEIEKKVREIARKVDLSDEQLTKAVSQLSGGQQQRVAIARALVTGPAIICMDEPLSNLDAKLRVQLRNELKRMQKEFGITTIYVTHDQEEALTLSDRIAVFNKGSIEQIGTPNEVYNHSKTEFVCNFIGDINKLSDDVSRKLGADPAMHNYIRLERIHVNVAPKDTDVVLKGTVEAREYYGLYIKYTIQLESQTIKVIEKNDGINIYEPGQQVNVVLNPRDVMAYPAEEVAQ